MAEAAESPAQSESMEDILQSIKRIIEDEPAANKPAAGEDVFDLTQMVKEDGSVAPVTSPAPPAPAVTPAPPPPPPVVEAPVVMEQTVPGSGLVSDEAANAALAALRPIVENTQKDLSIPKLSSPVLRNGNTVEDLVLEALRPMLKSWLDENLPLIVQKIVEKEVKRIVTFRQD